MTDTLYQTTPAAPEHQFLAAPHQPAPAVAAGELGIPLPLGLAGFGMTALMLSSINVGLFDASITPVVLPMAFFFGGITVILAGMWAFARGETFPAVALSSLGSFWISFTVIMKFVAPGLPPEQVGNAVGLFLLVWTVFATGACLPAAKTNVAVLAVTVGTALAFLALSVANFAESDGLIKLGGVLGLLTGLTAVYTAFAVLSNDIYGKTVLPIHPLHD